MTNEFQFEVKITPKLSSINMTQFNLTLAMTDSEITKVYIVHTENPQDQQPEEFHIKTLASVLGSEDAAKEGLIYSYKHAASGFTAKLTPEQVSELAKKPGVLQIVPSKTLHLHGPECM